MAPITTKAELDHYLRETPPGQSPLDALSPGGRKRFLAKLLFYPHGVGISYGEPDAELTHAQTIKLYGLFGKQDQAENLDIGLKPAQKARLDAERETDARARGCTVPTCPESQIEQHYDALVVQKPDASVPPAQQVALDIRRYDRLFTAYQTPERLRSTSAPDLRLLKRAVDNSLISPPRPPILLSCRWIWRKCSGAA